MGKKVMRDGVPVIGRFERMLRGVDMVTHRRRRRLMFLQESAAAGNKEESGMTTAEAVKLQESVAETA